MLSEVGEHRVSNRRRLIRRRLSELYMHTAPLLVDDSRTPPNQALEPTTPAVTIPAAQEVAPAGVVAHL